LVISRIKKSKTFQKEAMEELEQAKVRVERIIPGEEKI